ncbi:MAG: hypothetical protein GY798_15900 [Hyphomicrobiales bacterium]|nr:hypothetical protein [Hyphomicrobiales bacterium]
MAKLVVKDGFGIDMGKAGGGGQPSTIVNATSTGFRVDFGNGDYFVYKGENIKYNKDGDPKSGKLLSEKAYLDGDLFYKSTSWKAKIEELNDRNSFIAKNKYVYRNDDKLIGNDHFDALLSWGGDDVIKAGKGNDFLSGWKGNDKHFGESGKDMFHFAEGYDKDTIKDFQRKKDDIFLEKDVAKTYDDIADAASNYNKGMKLDFGKGDVLKIEGISKGKLDKIDFYITDYDFI